MVKNTKGGNKHKKMARKSNAPLNQEKIRFSSCDDEIYASVAKIYGNGRILVTCNDNVERQCVIRKKFRGKNKRHNEVSIGTYVLVGKRSWESTNTNKEVTDLLYVYSSDQVIGLKKNQVINNNVLSCNEKSFGNNEEENYTDFIDETKEEDCDIKFNEESSDEEIEYSEFVYEEKVNVDDI